MRSVKSWEGRAIGTLLGLLCLGTPYDAPADWAWSAGVEARGFEEEPAYANQVRDNAALKVRGRYTYGWDNTDFVTFSPFLRLDSADEERSTVDVDELGWTHLMESSELRLGARKVFWGVAESNHLVDIVNQTDLVAAPDGEEKLSQPMINLGIFTSGGSLDLFVLTGFRPRTFPGEKGRLRGPLVVEKEEYESERGRGSIDAAARWYQTIGPMDIGLSVFHGTSREPNYSPTEDGRALTAVYPLITQGGLEAQVISDAWIWKLEAVRRDGEGQTFSAGVAGVEYTFYGLADTPQDLTLFVEYSRDERDSLSPFSLDNDVFLGFRWTLNDPAALEFRGGLITDRDGGGEMGMLEGRRRLGTNWLAKFEARKFHDIGEDEAAHVIRQDSYLELSLERFF